MLRVKRAPRTRSSRQNAICAATSVFPISAPRRPPSATALRPCDFSESASATRVPRSAGPTPARSPVRAVTPTAKLSTRQSKLVSISIAVLPRANIESSRSRPHAAASRPRLPPTIAISIVSATSWRITRLLPAPIDKRIAISRSRAFARLISRLATLPHAIASSTPTIDRRTISGVFRSFRNPERPRCAGSSSTRCEDIRRRASASAESELLRKSRWKRTVNAAAAGAMLLRSGTRARTLSHSISRCGGHGFSRSPPELLAFDA